MSNVDNAQRICIARFMHFLFVGSATQLATGSFVQETVINLG